MGQGESETTRGLRDVLSSPYVWPLLCIAVLVVIANAPALFSLLSLNPLDLQTKLDPLSLTGVLPGFPTIDPNNGITTQALGHLAALDWLSAHVPWWNQYEGVGTPLAGEMSSAALLLPLVLLLTFSGGVVLFHMVLELIAGVAAYLFVRRLGVGIVAALVAGIAFALNGTFSWLGAAMVNPVAFLPLLLLGIELARSAALRDRRGGWLLISLASAIAVYSGFPETTAIDALFSGFWLLLRIHGLQRSVALQFIRKGLVGVVLGLALAAPLIIAFLDYVANGDIGGHGPGFAGVHLPHSAISMVVLPYVLGPIFGFYRNDPTGTIGAIWSNIGGYTTPAVAALASLAIFDSLFQRRDRWLRLGLLLWVILALSVTFGVPILDHVLELVPGISHTAFYRYAPPSWELALIVLAAFGIDDVLHARVTPRAGWTSALVTSLVVLGSTGIAFRLIHRLRGAAHIDLYAGGSALWALGVAVAVLLVVLWVCRGSVSRGRRGAVLLSLGVAVDVLAMFLVPQFSAPVHASVDTGSVTYLQSHLGEYRFFTLGPIQPDYGSYYGIADANTADLPLPQAWASYVTTSLAPNSNPITFSGTEANDPAGPSPWQQFVAHFANYEAIGVKYLVAATPTRPTAIPSRLGLRMVYSDRVATIYQLPHPDPMFEAESKACSVQSSSPSRVVVDCKAPATVIRREQYFAGWTASIGGRSTPVRRSGPLFQAVSVPAGRSVVLFAYQPQYLLVGLGAGAIGLAAICGGLAVTAAERRRRPGNEEDG